MPGKGVSRREFVRRAGAAAAAFHIVPRHVLGRGYRAPSDTLSIGCVGVGGMGRTDVRGLESETIYALCDVDSKMAEDAFVSYPRAKRYRDFREMLDKDGRNIDAVTVSTADHTHAVVAMAALKAGKHVYCQKPLARTLSEVRALMAEARGRPSQATQMGNQGHSQEGTRQIREWVEAGQIGNVPAGRALDRSPDLAPGDRPPDRGAQCPALDGLGPVARPRGEPALSSRVCAVPLARVVGFRHRGTGRHRLPLDGRPVLGARPRFPPPGSARSRARSFPRRPRSHLASSTSFPPRGGEARFGSCGGMGGCCRPSRSCWTRNGRR